MIAERYIYYILFIIFLIGLMVALWFLAIYTNVPSWVGWLFVVGIVILVMGALIKECVMVNYCYWNTIYIAVQILGLLVILGGTYFAISYSNINWGVWVLFALAIIFTVVGNMLMALIPDNTAYGIIVSITGFIIFIVLLFALISQGPRSINTDLTLNGVFWYFPFVALIIIIGIISVLFEGSSECVNRCCLDPCCDNQYCPKTKQCCSVKVEEPICCKVEEPICCKVEEPICCT